MGAGELKVSDQLINGECRRCCWGPIYADTKLCENCDSAYIECSICKEEQWPDSRCRHVFMDGNLEWRGAGAGCDGQDFRQPLFLLFDLMPMGFPEELRDAIRSGRFFTWLIAPMIGGGGRLKLNGMADPWKWSDHIIELGEDEDTGELTADAYHWLVSLHENDTLVANKLTIRWINEYLRQPHGWRGERVA